MIMIYRHPQSQNLNAGESLLFFGFLHLAARFLVTPVREEVAAEKFNIINNIWSIKHHHQQHHRHQHLEHQHQPLS